MIGKTQNLSNGRIIVTDFRNLNLSDFAPLYNNLSRHKLKQEMLILSPNGVLYVNRNCYGYEFVRGTFELLIKDTDENLTEMEKTLTSRFPDITNFNEWRQMKGTEEEKMQVFVMLTIRIELQRRELDRNYY